MCACTLCIISARLHVHVVVKSDYQHPGSTRRSTQLAAQPSLGKNTGKPPSVVRKGLNSHVFWYKKLPDIGSPLNDNLT